MRSPAINCYYCEHIVYRYMNPITSEVMMMVGGASNAEK